MSYTLENTKINKEDGAIREGIWLEMLGRKFSFIPSRSFHNATVQPSVSFSKLHILIVVFYLI